MSAQLQSGAPVAHPGSTFNANIPLAGGAYAYISAPTLVSLSAIVAMLQPAANEGNVSTPTVATAPAGSTGTQTAAPSATTAAASAAGDAGNAASTGASASAQPAAAGSAPTGDSGNAAAGAPQGAGSASNAAAPKPSDVPAVTFEELKKAFLALSTKAGGREKCEGVLKPFNLPKLSAATEAQYPAVMAEIKKASA